MTRGFSEMTRIAQLRGAKAETLNGLSGFGDLVLTCTSAQSRNFRFGQALGRGETFDAGVTVEARRRQKPSLFLPKSTRSNCRLPLWSRRS